MNFKIGDFVVPRKFIYNRNYLQSNRVYQVKDIKNVWIGVVCEHPEKSIAEGKPNWSKDNFRLATHEEIEYYNFFKKLEDLINE